MSWNRIILGMLLVMNLVKSQEFMQRSYDEMIIRGLIYDEYKAYENSYEIYKNLYDTTGVGDFLFREATSALMMSKHIAMSISRLKQWESTHPNTLEVRRLLIPLYLTNKELNNAKREAEYLLEQSREPIDLDLASNSYLYTGNYKRALALLTKIYSNVPREDILLRMVEIMDELTHQRKQAIQLLETHRRMNKEVSEELYHSLIRLYHKEKNIQGILESYKALYREYDSEEYLAKIMEVYLYKKDIKGAIVFLEEDRSDDILLYELYKLQRAFSKALGLVDKLYAEDKDPKWLAEKGILTFENAKNKNDKKMLRRVILYFEEAIALGNDDSIYLNYYGYTLIEKGIDIKKGIKVIEDTLVQQPNNTYYLDSLAWGYYKQHKYKKAYRFMKRVVDEEGLEEEEIRQHWNKIKRFR